MSLVPGASGTPASMPDGFTGLGVKANFQADSNVTLLSTDTDTQYFNITASRTVTLPSTDPTTGKTVKQGRQFTFVNRGAFDLVFNASGGSSILLANGANQDATIRIGNVALRALQDTPTTPAHWFVEYFYSDSGIVTYAGVPTVSGGSAPTSLTASYRWTQVGSLVTLAIIGSYAVAGSGNTQIFIPFPTTAPKPGGLGVVTLDGRYAYQGSGTFEQGDGSVTLAPPWLVNTTINAAGTPQFEVRTPSTSILGKVFRVSVTYFKA